MNARPTKTLPPISVVPKGCQVMLWAGFILGTLVMLWVYWLMPLATIHLAGSPNRLKISLLNELGVPITNGVVKYSLSQQVPIIPVPYGGLRRVEESKAAISDAKGVAEITWQNMNLAVQTVSVAGASYPIEPIYTLGGSVVARTPDGKSTWDVGTNYAARIIVDRSSHVATVRPE